MKRTLQTLLIITTLLSITAEAESFPKKNDLKNSLAYITIYSQAYNQYMPWKKKNVSKNTYYGCAVSSSQILTTAEAVINSTFIKIKLNSSNEYLSATIKSLDYSLNLALLEIDDGQDYKPLKPVLFGDYKEGAQLRSYWLNSRSEVITGRGYMDRAIVDKSNCSHTKNLTYVVANGSQETGWGEIFYDQDKAVGIASWFDSDSKESGIVPAETINRFLKESSKDSYHGFGMIGFKAEKLIDPARRKFLSLPDDETNGVFISSLRNIGTGANELKVNDCIVAIDNHTINAYGKFKHPLYGELDYQYLITSKPIGEKISFEIYRGGKKQLLEIECKNFKVEDMLIPYYQRSEQPKYIIRGGFVFEQLTRPYLRLWGNDWRGKVPPYLLDIYKRLSFKPTPEKKEVIILSQVIPDDINVGYQQLAGLVVSKINNKNITSMDDVFAALNGDSIDGFDIIEFELDYPTIVIDRNKASIADTSISQRYRIPQLQNK